MTVLALDPGKNIGRSLWSNQGIMLFKDVIDLDTALSYLVNAEGVDTVVYEDWQLFTRQVEQTGSRMEASQLIGAIKLWEKLDERRFAKAQPSSILPISALHIGIKLPKGHTPDEISAMLHGHYWFVERGILKPHDVVD